jgi:putative salt-induced outer membrane protein YdiY
MVKIVTRAEPHGAWPNRDGADRTPAMLRSLCKGSLVVHRLFAAAAALLLAVAPASGATVTLNNGDTLTGQVARRSAEQLVVEHAVLGELTIDRAEIAAIDADPQTDRDQAAGDSQPDAAADRAAQQAAGAAPGEAEATPGSDGAAEPTPAKPVETTILPQWDKSLALGFSGRQGNAETGSFNAHLQLKKDTDAARVNFNNKFFYATSGDDTTQNELSSQLNLDWLQPDTDWFFFMQGGYEFDDFEPWRHRVSVYGGPGYTFVDNQDIEVVGRVGAGANYEFGSVNDITPEGLVGTETIRWHLTDNQNLTGGLTYYPSFESIDKYRLNANAEWQIKIDRASGLSLKLGVENEYESITQDDARPNDFKYYGALNYDF